MRTRTNCMERNKAEPQRRKKHAVRNLLLMITVFLLGLALPFVLLENMKHGTLYLFTDQFWDDLILRFQGAGRFRFLLQPGTAVILGLLNGKQDAARGRHGYLRRIISRQAGWKESVQHGFNTVSILLIMGTLADIVFQYILMGIVHILPALILGPLFISVPYAVARGISSRIKRRSSSESE